MERKNYNKAPKKIWTYWDNPDKPSKTVQMCIDSWKKYNPDYEIVILTRKNYKGYINIPEELTSHPNFNDIPEHLVDLIQCYTLAEHGGIWCTPSTLLKAPLDDWMFPKYAEFSGFYYDTLTQNKEYPVIDGAFIAANKNSKFMRAIQTEITQVAKYKTVDLYIESRRKMGVDFQGIADPYRALIQVATQKVLQIDKYPLETLILKKAEDGPYKYLMDTKWDSGKALQLACAQQKYQTPIIILRTDEHNELEKRIDYDLTVDKCEWV